MRHLIFGFMWALGLAASPGAFLHSEELVWRCGNTLTNQRPSDEAQRQTCVPQKLAPLTLLSAPVFAEVPAPPSIATSKAGPAPAMGTWSNPEEQKKRDQMARELLLTEKQNITNRLQEAQKKGDQAQIELNRADLMAIERELARRP